MVDPSREISSHKFHSCQGDDCHWLMLPGEETVLFSEGDYHPLRLLDRFPHQTLKAGAHRTVHRLETTSGRFYLKHYKAKDWKSRLQNWARTSRARIEWNHTWQLINLGFDSCTPVALGEEQVGPFVGDSFLITREIPESMQLDHFVEERLPGLELPLQNKLRFELARQLGMVTAQLQLQGVQHRDYHAGNILVTADLSNSSLKLWLIDLHQVKFRKQLKSRESLKNIVLLNSYFSNRGNAADRRRFFHAFWETLLAGGFTPDKTFLSYKQSAQLAEQTCDQKMWKEFTRADQKWDRGNRRLIILEPEGENSCRGVTELGHKFLDFARLNSKSLTETDLPGFARVNFSRFPPESRFSVRAAWNFGHAFIRRRLPTPRPLLFVESEEGSILVTEDIKGAIPLTTLINQVDEPALTFQQRRALTRRLAAQLAWRDQCGYIDRAPTLAHILVHPETGEIYFTHLGELEQTPQEIGEDEQLRVLAAWVAEATKLPNLTQTDRLRFLKRYLQGKSTDWKRYWTRIDSEVHSSST
ncbi:MAG: lipopolysaccharide kinase InaA family protein [Planctomycetaceae bacterium]